MNWLEPLQEYCERTDGSFWSEPSNALSNIAFPISAFIAGRLLINVSRPDNEALLLIRVLWLVGLGSFIFHTFATRWAEILDIIPIVIFVILYLFLGLRRFFNFSPIITLLIFSTFGVSLMSAVEHIDLFNGSVIYAPALSVLIMYFIFFLLAIPDMRSIHGSYMMTTFSLGLAVLFFIISIIFRTIDKLYCEQFPIGTHFIWHILNSVVIFLLISAFVFFKDFKSVIIYDFFLKIRREKKPKCRL